MATPHFDSGSTPFDDVFRTLVVEHSSLLISLINEMFPGTNYSGNEKTIPLNETYFINRDTGEQDKRILDSALAIISSDGASRIFHLECQSTPDGSMILRIFEYDTQIALKTSGIVEGNILEIAMPTTGILYLRSNSSTPDKMTIKLIAPSGDNLRYDVPIMKLKDYDCDSILEKELYFLIPFYLFNFEDDFDKIESGDMTVTESFRKRFSKLYDLLKERLNDGRIDVMSHHSIIMLTKKVIAALTTDKAAVKEEADKIMGGQVIDYETKVIYRHGLEQGVANHLIEQICKKLSKGKTFDVIAEELEEPVDKIKAICEVAQNHAPEYNPDEILCELNGKGIL